MIKKYVQYGCGFCAPHDWLNFDSSLTLRFERLPILGKLYTKNSQRFPANVRYGDIVKGLPIADLCCDGVYSSHMLDYISYDDCKLALRNTKRIMRSGATFRVAVQDCTYFIERYLANDSDDATTEFMISTGWGRKTTPRSPMAISKWYFGHGHRLWMWDFKSLSRELAEAGFHSIRAAALGDSGIPAFSSVENPGRWKHAVAIDCKA